MSDTAPTLSRVFDPPDGFVGGFGWLCGYSADARFLDHALERFTRLTAPRRAAEGRGWLAAVLHPSGPYLGPATVPGLLHLRLPAPPPFQLLHAKVAVLGFRADKGPAFRMRVVVCTGNWTWQTLQDSLDLAWVADVDSAELDRPGPHTVANRRDLGAAADLLAWVTALADRRILDATTGAVAGLTRRAEREWQDSVTRAGTTQGPSRVFDNRHRSLLASLSRRIRQVAGGSARSDLVLGSGFYEGGRDDGLPSIPRRIVETLRDEGLLTASSRTELVVEPGACQAVAASVASGAVAEARWTVAAALDPAARGGAPRRLHAKFLFSGRFSRTKDSCGSAWLYLGSGNLTHPGFAARATPTRGAERSRGNLEAGVLISAAGLALSDVAGRLPWAPEGVDLSASADSLAAGDGMVDPEPAWAPPVAWFSLSGAESLWLTPDLPLGGETVLLGAEGDPISADGDAYRWRWDAPSEVEVVWGPDRQHARVPVVDAAGRLGARPLPPLGIREAEGQLLAFPDPPEEEELEGDGSDPDPDRGDGNPPQPDGRIEPSPRGPAPHIRDLVRLFERIAAIQSGLERPDWPAWCVRLEQVLVRLKDADGVAYLQELRVDPVIALVEPAFLPPWVAPEDRIAYRALLGRVVEAWDLPGRAGLVPEELRA